MTKIPFVLSALFILTFLQGGFSMASGISLTYHEFNDQNTAGKVIGETFITIGERSSDQTVVNRQKQFKHCMIKDEFVIDREYSLDKWRRVCADEDTDYIAERNGNILTVKGRIKGEVVDKELELGNKALHIYPKYSLSKFALSGMPSMKLWSMRRDEMTLLPMQAVRKGVETITVNSKDVEVIKVYYSITGKLREKYYNHYYYFRKSDGLFLKKVENNGRVEVLVSEG